MFAMQSSMDTRMESDKRGIVELEIEEDGSSSTSSKFKTSYCCVNRYTTIPIILSTISLFLALGTIFGVAIRWSQMNSELKNMQNTIDLLTSHNNKLSSSVAQAQKSTAAPTPPVSGSTYIHWGKKTCNRDASLVYSGFGAGSASSSDTRGGGGAQYLCMPPNPEYNKYDRSNDSVAHSWLYSAEYMSYNLGIFPDATHGHNLACSVCHAPRSAKTMIPARRTCPIGWTPEYEGYLMGSYVTDQKMSYECVDAEPDVIGGTQNVTGGAALNFVSGYCGSWGGLAHCPPYVDAREITCVVCTK